MFKLFIDPANLITTFGLILGFLGSVAASTSNFNVAILLALSAVLCDTVDGTIARRTRGSPSALHNSLGVQMDSLADVIHSGACPAAFILSFFDFTPVAFCIAIMMLIAAMWRLAYFNVVGVDEQGRYSGLPIFYSPMMLAAAYFSVTVIGLWILVVYAVLTPLLNMALMMKVSRPKGVWKCIFFIILFLQLIYSAALVVGGKS